MILPQALLDRIIAHAETTYPEECCGLLIGARGKDGCAVVDCIEPAANVTTDGRADSFAIDPRVRFAVMRRLRQEGGVIVGHYHSHPDQPAVPSARDLRLAFEPELLWLIVAVRDGCAVDRRAYALDADRQCFNEIPVRVVHDIPGRDNHD